TLGGFSLAQQQAVTRLALDQELSLQYENLIAAFDYEGRAAVAVATALGNLPPVQDAIEAGDRTALDRMLLPAYPALKALGIPLPPIFPPPATGFYRMHDPKAFGDDASTRRKTVVLAIEQQQAIAGVEPGRDNLSVFGSVPVSRGGKHLAAFDVGISFG